MKRPHPLLLVAATAGAAPAFAALPAPAHAGEHVVTMAGVAYAPAEVGDTIRFVNDDAVDHNVYVPTAGFGLDLGKQEPGAERTVRLGKAATFEVECVFHPAMLVRVEVAE